MSVAMTQFKTTADAHMRRDMEGGKKWTCACEACHEIRSLMGMNKTLAVRPLVRELQEIGEQLEGLPEGPARKQLADRYIHLYDQLAREMAK